MKDVKTHVKSIILALGIKNVLYQIRYQQELSHVFARMGPYFLRREIVKKVNLIFDDSKQIFAYFKQGNHSERSWLHQIYIIL